MNDRPTAPRGGNNRKRRPPRRRRTSPGLVLGWILLGAGLIAATAALIALLPGRETAPETPVVVSTPVPEAQVPVSAFEVEETAPPVTYLEGTRGRKVDIGAFQCDFTPPESVSVGIVHSVDLTALGERIRANVLATGWGEVTCVETGNGELLIRAATQAVLNGDDLELQEAFLSSGQPENLARTFLENSGLPGLLREQGLDLSDTVENKDGLITFRGSGEGTDTGCTISFSFLYTGAFNQAVIRATTRADAVSIGEVLTLKEAGKNAVSWSSAQGGKATVTAAELRSIRGLPFYVFTLADGGTAYALSVNRASLALAPGAEAVYDELMQSGIQEYTDIPGAA